MKIKILQFEIKEADFEANKDTIESLISENYKIQILSLYQKCGIWGMRSLNKSVNR